MFPPKIRLREASFRHVILACFFISGACGLIYQVAWLRVMGLLFGNTTFAACTVLAGYMAGLGLGALYFGRKIDRQGNPVLFYARLELGVAAYAFITPFLWKFMEWGCVLFYRGVQPDFFSLCAFRFAIAFAALFIPTFLMGGTLPVMVKYFVRRETDTAREVGRLYALNTAGAVAGVYFSGFYMLYSFGVWQSAVLTGVLNLFIYYVVSRTAPAADQKGLTPVPLGSSDVAPPPAGTQLFAGSSGLFLFLFAISGAVSMVYEIGWTRVLAISLGSSVYAFSIMLATFLLGIALGSWLFSLASKRFSMGVAAFAFLEILTAIFVLVGLNQFDDLSYRFVQVFQWTGGKTILMDFGRFILCASVMLPPTLCIGALFACFLHIYQRENQIGSDVGKAYFANTLGTIAGAVLTGFALIPIIGVQKTLLAGAWLNAGIGAIVFVVAWRKFSMKMAIVLSVMLLIVGMSSWAVEPWNKSVLSSDTAVNPSRVKGLTQEQFLRSMRERETIFYKEGAMATVSVTRLRDNLSLAVNGKTDASTSDAFTQFFLGHLPFFVKPDAQSALVIGLGSASTLAAAASHPVKRLDAVELEGAVIEAARFFKDLNRDVLEDERVRLFQNDGRNQLLMHQDKYDVIISEPSNPWMAGVANLFSYEHYETVLKRLNTGGVVCQWLHAYSMSTDDLQMIIKTFTAVFPHASLWTSNYPDLMLLGSDKELVYDMEDIREVYRRPHVAQDLGRYGFNTPEAFFANYWLGSNELQRLVQGGKLNTDNFPRLEFSAPRYLYAQTFLPNFTFLNRYRSMEFPVIQKLTPEVEVNGKFYLQLVRAYIAKRFMREAQWALERAWQLGPVSDEHVLVRAEFDYANKQRAEARRQFETLTKDKPQSARALDFLGKIAMDQNDLDRAYLYLHKAVLLEPQNEIFLRTYFEVICERKDIKEAGIVYEHLKALKQDDFEMTALFSKLIFSDAPRPAQAAMASLLIERYPRFEGAYVKLAELYESAGRSWDALRVYQKMAEFFPEDGRTHLRMAVLYKNLKKEKESKSSLRKALQLNPSFRKNTVLLKTLRE